MPIGSCGLLMSRPHGSNAANREWSTGPHEPYWRTNTSFSPPPPRWDFHFQSDGPSFGSQEGSQLYGSSTSSNSRESRSWLRGNYLPNHQHSASDGVAPYLSSPSGFSPAQQWAPPTIQEISADDYGNSSRRVLGSRSFSPAMEGTSVTHDSRGSTSSRSDSGDYDVMPRSQSSHRNFSGRRSFMSKPVHPLSFPSERDIISEFDDTSHQRERHRFSTGSPDIDFSDVSEPIESYSSLSRSFNPSDGFKCGLCERFLSQRSPWSSRRIVSSGDMPVTGVLSCRHVFHAECLDQTTPKTRKNDPPCPICVRSEEENSSSPDQRVFSKLRNSFPKLRPFREDGPSKPWTCTQASDCLEGALNAQSRNAMLLLNKNRLKKNLSLKSIGKEFPSKMKKNGLYSSQLCIGPVDRPVDQGGVGSSSKAAAAGSSTRR